MKILVIGAGYVGLVAAACFADMGNNVICVDNDEHKIANLTKGIIPIYEPGLKEIVKNNVSASRLTFTLDVENAVKQCEICFITVGTPSKEDGSANLDYVFSVANSIGKAMNGYKVIVIKSTCPVGTADKVKSIISSLTRYKFDVASNPEFLKQGKAVNDFLHPDRTIIGVDSNKAESILSNLYSSFYQKDDGIILMDIKSAEMTKYAANAFLATKISFINEMAILCDKVGADVEMVRKGLVGDSRIGNKFLFPGVGFGGSCFPKDINALISLGKSSGCPLPLVSSVKDINDRQFFALIDLILNYFNHDLSHKKFAVWGLAFKPETDDMRDAPSVKIINFLLNRGSKINAYDPKAIGRAKQIFQDKINFFDNQYDALDNCDALIVLTEWNEFKKIDNAKIKKQLKDAVIFDGRNIYEPKDFKNTHIKYYCIGRNSNFPRNSR